MKTSTRYTLEFVRSELPDGATRVLEIGCGSGELAAQLLHAGLEVVAIDSDARSATAARALGVDARAETWPAPVDGKFDAVLFTRSLHHIHELDAAIACAADVLASGGRIIVEDFRAEGAGARSRRWYAGLARVLAECGSLSGASLDQLLAKVGDGSDDHDLHGSRRIEGALGARLATDRRDAAYYFRYFEPALTREAATQAVLEMELDLIQLRSIDALGRRYVARI